MIISKKIITYYKVWLCVAWLILQIYFWHSLHIKIVHDSHRFINLANFMLDNGTILFNHATRYIGYSLFLVPIFKLGGNYQTVLLIQILLSGIALVALYKTALYLTQSELIALVTVSFSLLWVELSAWNFYLMTESLFISCTVIAFYILLQARRIWHYLICFLLFLFILLLRPNGFIYAIAAATYLIMLLWQKQPKLQGGLAFIGISLVLAVLILLDKYLLVTFNILDVYQRGDIIFGYWAILIKPDVALIPTTSSPLLNILLFVFYNISYFIKAGFLKVFYFFAHVKPYYSIGHNFYIIIILYPLYYLACAAKKTNQPAFYFIYIIIVLQATIVFLTSEDWDGRFLIPILPYIFILSAMGLVLILKIVEAER